MTTAKRPKPQPLPPCPLCGRAARVRRVYLTPPEWLVGCEDSATHTVTTMNEHLVLAESGWRKLALAGKRRKP